MKRKDVKFGLNVSVKERYTKTFIVGFDCDGDVDVIGFYSKRKLITDWQNVKNIKVNKIQKKRLYRIKQNNDEYAYVLIYNKMLYSTESYDILSLSKVRKSLIIVLNSNNKDCLDEEIFYDVNKHSKDEISIGCFYFKQSNIIRFWNHMAKDHKFMKPIKKIKKIYQ